MRKPRVNIFDDDVSTLKMLKAFISQLDYEILTFDKPVDCPIYGTIDNCANLKPCADIIITDYRMPGMTGLEMLLHQAQKGCKIDTRNIIVMSSGLDRKGQMMLEELGCAFFSKPLNFNGLLSYLDECEKRTDLSKPLGIIRKEDRHPANIDILYAYNSAEKVYRATVMDYSLSGLCLKVDTPLAELQSIAIRTKLPNDCNTASVRWVKEMGLSFYLAGCHCR